jgi:hypothetical protein
MTQRPLFRSRKMTKAQSKRAGYVCAYRGCGEYCPGDEGGWGPPLLDPNAKWFCNHHLAIVWKKWKAKQ